MISCWSVEFHIEINSLFDLQSNVYFFYINNKSIPSSLWFWIVFHVCTTHLKNALHTGISSRVESYCVCLSLCVCYYYFTFHSVNETVEHITSLELLTDNHQRKTDTHTRARALSVCVGTKNLLWYARKLTKLMISLYTANRLIIQIQGAFIVTLEPYNSNHRFMRYRMVSASHSLSKYPSFDSCHVAA